MRLTNVAKYVYGNTIQIRVVKSFYKDETTHHKADKILTFCELLYFLPQSMFSYTTTF